MPCCGIPVGEIVVGDVVGFDGGPQGTPLSQRENTANKENSLQT